MRGTVLVVMVLVLAGCSGLEAPAPDMSDVADASDVADVPEARAGAFACSTGTCEGSTEYCYSGSGGPDAGGIPGGDCMPLPTACLANRTCDCLRAAAPQFTCACILDGGLNASCNGP
jgi:hypothetical protein